MAQLVAIANFVNVVTVQEAVSLSGLEMVSTREDMDLFDLPKKEFKRALAKMKRHESANSNKIKDEGGKKWRKLELGDRTTGGIEGGECC